MSMMKLWILGILLGLSTTALGITNWLENDSETAVLIALNNVCGDTWCEGDFDYEFRSLACYRETSRCALAFDFIGQDDVPRNPHGADVNRLTVECTLGTILSLDDILRGSGVFQTLNSSFYQQVSRCIDTNSDAAYEAIYPDI